jgi:hypothetical protein
MMNEDFRNQIFNTLNQKETSELVEIWQKNDRVEWSEEAFLIIQEILQSRLGELPAQDPPIYESVDEVEGNKEADYYDQRIKSFLEAKNIDGLVDILKNEPDSILRLEAGEALAKLGDERGLDYLIDALEFDDVNISYDAEEILSELNIPRGVLALHSHLLDHNRTIYSKANTPLSEKDYVVAYISTILFGFFVSLIFYIFPLPNLLGFILNLVAGYYVFKYVVKKQIVGI